MIVTCPACDTRYSVDDTSLGGNAGRRVRCASCGNLWHHSAESVAIHTTLAEAAASATVASAVELPRVLPLPPPAAPRLAEVAADFRPPAPSALPRPSVAVELPAVARRRRRHIAEFVLVLLAVLVAIIAVFSRDRIMGIWPATVPLYARLHLTEAPTAGLTVKALTPTHTADSLIIDGDIVNGAAVTRQIPRLRVTLRDGDKNEVDSKEIDPPVDRLAPGATIHFNTVFDHPKNAATGVAVSFATD